MAKSKAKPPAVEPEQPPSAAPPSQPAPSRTIVTMKGGEAWNRWLTMAAREARTDRVGFLDRAAAELAEKLGIPKPPPRL